MQVAALAVVSALAASVIKKQVPDLALALTLCGVTLVLAMGMRAFAPARQLMGELAERAGLSAAALAPVMKTVGIALLTRITAELCRDAKESGLASAVEITGSACAILVCLPLLESVLGLILELL